MNKEEWLKAIKCSKEELIEWLNEMYENEKRLKEIIGTYEQKSNAHKERHTIKTKDLKGEDRIYIEEVTTTIINGEKITYKNIHF